MRTGGWSMKATVEYTRARGRLERSVEKANKTINIDREGFRISLFFASHFRTVIYWRNARGSLRVMRFHEETVWLSPNGAGSRARCGMWTKSPVMFHRDSMLHTSNAITFHKTMLHASNAITVADDADVYTSHRSAILIAPPGRCRAHLHLSPNTPKISCSVREAIISPSVNFVPSFLRMTSLYSPL